MNETFQNFWASPIKTKALCGGQKKKNFYLLFCTRFDVPYFFQTWGIIMKNV
jgi:hypothetical protein